MTSGFLPTRRPGRRRFPKNEIAPPWVSLSKAGLVAGGKLAGLTQGVTETAAAGYVRKGALFCQTDTDKSVPLLFSATATKSRRCFAMNSEFHIFFCEGEAAVRVRQAGFQDSREFPSLGNATRHLRQCMQGEGGLVVIHNGNEAEVNRIPLLTSLRGVEAGS